MARALSAANGHPRHERPLYVASALTNVGDWLTYVAVASLATTGTNPGRSLALVVLGQTLPRAALAPIAGRVVDRVERTRAYAVAEASRGLVVLVMALLAYRGEMGALLLLHAVRGGLGAFSDTALRAAVPEVVGADRLESVNRRLGTIWSVAFVVGIAGGGAIVARFGLVAAFLGDAASFFLGALAFVALPRAAQSTLRSDADGTTDTSRIPPVALFRAPLGLAHGAAFVLVAPGFASAGAAAIGLSVVHGARALGNAAGAALGTRARATMVFTPLGLAGVALATIGGPRSVVGVVGALAWGAGLGALYTSVTHALQSTVPRDALGRALARDGMVFTLAWAAGACGAGLSPFARSTTMATMVAVVLVVFALTLALDRRDRARRGAP